MAAAALSSVLKVKTNGWLFGESGRGLEEEKVEEEEEEEQEEKEEEEEHKSRRTGCG